MGSMVPGQPNFFAQIMAAYMDGVQKRRQREAFEQEQMLAEEDRALRREDLKLRQQALKVEELGAKRQTGMAQFGAMDGTPARSTSLPGSPAEPGGFSFGEDGSMRTSPSTPQVDPRSISLPHRQIDLGGGALVQPQTQEQKLLQLLAKGLQDAQLAGVTKREESAVPTGAYGDRYRGMGSIDSRLLQALPPQVQAVAPQPGVVPGQVLDAPALTASSGIMNEQGEQRRADASNAVARGNLGVAQGNLGVARDRLAYDKTGVGRQPTEAERRTLTFYDRAKDAETAVADIEPQIAGLGLMGQARLQHAPNAMQSQEGQFYRQAQRQFTEARLRKDSGAAIPPAEYENDARTYFAQPGDTPATLERKKAARAVVLSALQREAGRAYQDAYGVPQGAGVNVQSGPAPNLSGEPRRIGSDAEWSALPPGTVYVGPDGVTRKK